MPIKIPNSLPARETLEGENIFVMTEYRAMHQDIRPLKLLILNLMPTKIATETQLLRKFSNTPLQIQVELLQTISHSAQNVDRSHLESFYTSFDQIKNKYYDGLVITGAREILPQQHTKHRRLCPCPAASAPPAALPSVWRRSLTAESRS